MQLHEWADQVNRWFIKLVRAEFVELIREDAGEAG